MVPVTKYPLCEFPHPILPILLIISLNLKAALILLLLSAICAIAI